MSDTLNKIETGMRLYYTGDIANLPCTGTVIGIKVDRWGSKALVQWDVEEGGVVPARWMETGTLLDNIRYREAYMFEDRKLPAKPFEPELTNID